VGLAIAAISVGALGAGAPAHAEEPPAGNDTQQGEVHATAEFRTIGYSVDLVGTPRRGAPAIARLEAGTPVTAFCAFANDGQDWVKIQHTAQFGFVPARAAGGFGSLPKECPNEIETVDVLVFNHYFQGTDFVGELPSSRCPGSWPLLVDVKYANHEFPQVPRGVRIHNARTGIVAVTGLIHSTWVNEKWYASGFFGGTVTNWGLHDQLGQVWMTCTNNASKGYTP
jgi:hypothetical protein